MLYPPVHKICDDQITELEVYFNSFRKKIIGHQQVLCSPFGEKEIVYADWTASGRAFGPIEECMQKEIMPFIGNTHTEATITGELMGRAYEKAKTIIKEHVNAASDDALVFCGSGMTAAVNKLQRILGLRMPERIMDYMKMNAMQVDEKLRPIVFVTEMEHHSNQVSWLETIAEVAIIRNGGNGNVDLEYFDNLLERYKHRKNKIAAVTGCSNVTGIQTPYGEIAKMIHEHDGLCFVDFACSAPYININMHPEECGAHLDAIYFSPHKFLGGPGTPGVLIFNKKLYANRVPDQPGGGTVVYSNPWNVCEYIKNIELREDGGTPPFLQGIKAAMCMKLKEEMGVENILKREEELLEIIFERFSDMRNVEVLGANVKKRLGVVSFIIKGAHYNWVVKILNDKFGIQTRGGCSCAGTYGHRLLQVDENRSYQILDSIRSGNLRSKPGWVRLSIHPTMTTGEIDFIMDAIERTASCFPEWIKDYDYEPVSNEWMNKKPQEMVHPHVDDWFDPNSWERSME